MTDATKTYRIAPELEKALLAAATSGNAVRVKGKSTHSLYVSIDSKNIWSGYDPKALIDAVEESSINPYSATQEELEGLLADLAAAREQDSTGRPA